MNTVTEAMRGEGTRADEPVGLLDAVRAGRTSEVVSLLDGMTDAERRACLPELKALRKELRTARWTAESRRALPALHAAGAACQTGAAGVANWLAATDLRWAQASPRLLLHLLGDRDPRWLADVAHRLARRPVTARVPYELMAGLVRLAGCPVPVTDAYVRGWLDHIDQGWRHGGTKLDRLRRDPHLVPLVAALMETDEVGSRLEWPHDDGPDSWTGALARLADEGTLDRGTLVDACVARLLRGGSAADQRVFLRLLDALALTRAEERSRVADWLALASDAVSPVAAHAQSVLAALALDGDLTTRRLADMSAAVLFRPEKKLVRSQLVLLGKVLLRSPGGAPELLPAAAQAFGHADAEVQERALKLVERHLAKLDSPALRGELALSAEQLIPSLRERAARTLGLGPCLGEPVVHEEVLPPVPEPVRLAPPPESAAELAEEIGAVMLSGGDVPSFERALDGLVRHAHRDRKGLVEALAPVVDRRWWAAAPPVYGIRPADHFGPEHRVLSTAAEAFDLLLATLHGTVHTPALRAAAADATRGHAEDCVHAPLARAFDARLWEVAHRLRTDPLPFLLSTPTWSTGLLEPEVLVDRLVAYHRLGARPAEQDFAQALLRVRRADRATAEHAAERALALGTAEGARLARRLTSPPAEPAGHTRREGALILVEIGEVDDVPADLPAAPRSLGDPVSVSMAHRYCHHWSEEIRPHWLALLPERREAVAARFLWDLAALAVEDSRGAGRLLPLIAESGGEAGPAVHLGIAYGLGARHAEDRLAAVDALLTLTARGQLVPERLGAALGRLVRSGAVKPLRLAESARTAAATGANSTLWGVLRHTLPVLLADLAAADGARPQRGLGDLLAVAAACAERSGAQGELPYLERTVARRGSSRLVAEARRLHRALTGEAAA
ncbi:DUF7824 domain-containing protein [Streptomyces sp. enrichment culture]|uniref:DUF7824 domain-containing protein n=1 Tax=Streptomyces sp. enrichment culture TaxID=1795815 RepID=UPI003F57989C